MDVKVVDSKLLLARDYSTLMEWAVGKIPKITDDWTDFSITSPEMIWLSDVCYCYDMLNYTLDKKFLDNQIRFSRNFENILNMCGLRGVEIPGVQTSKMILHFKYDVYDGSTILIPKGSIFKVYDPDSSKNLNFCTVEEYNIISGNGNVSNSFNNIICYEGEYKRRTLISTDISPVGTCLIKEPYIAENITSLNVDGVSWRRVSDAFLITSNIPSYSLSINKNNETVVKFSPEFRNAMSNAEVVFNYFTSSGKSGNISQASKIKADFIFVDDSDVRVPEEFIEMVVRSCGGGADAFGLEESRQLLGTTSADVNTLVTDVDYIDAVKRVSYVYSCAVKIVDDVKQVFYVAYKDLSVYGTNDTDLSNYIYSLLIDRLPVFTELQVTPIVVRPVSINIKVMLNRNELNTTKLEEIIKSSITTRYDRSVVNPGMEFNRTLLAKYLEDLGYSISHVLIEYPKMDVLCAWNEIIEIDSIQVSFERR